MKRRNGRRVLMAGILCAAFLAGCNGGERSQTEAAQEQETSYGQKTTEQPGTPGGSRGGGDDESGNGK